LMAGFRVALGVGGAAVVIALLAPLAIFMAEAAHNPGIIEVEVEAAPGGGLLRVAYNGSMPLSDFEVYAGDTVIHVGYVSRGVKTVPLTPQQLAAIEERGITGLSFKIAGLYSIKQVKG